MKSMLMGLALLSMMMVGCGDAGDDGGDANGGDTEKTTEQLETEAKAMTLDQIEAASRKAQDAGNVLQDAAKEFEKKMAPLAATPDSAELKALQEEFNAVLSKIMKNSTLCRIYEEAYYEKKAAEKEAAEK